MTRTMLPCPKFVRTPAKSLRPSARRPARTTSPVSANHATSRTSPADATAATAATAAAVDANDSAAKPCPTPTSPTAVNSSRSKACWTCATMATASCARRVITPRPTTSTSRSTKYAVTTFERATPSSVASGRRPRMRSTRHCFVSTAWLVLILRSRDCVLVSKT